VNDQDIVLLGKDKQDNVPFVFLLKKSGDISNAVRRFADELGVPYEVVRDVIGTFCKLDILLVVTYLGTLHRNSLSNVRSWAPVKTEVSCIIIVPMNIG
jgi:hypothetical protein